MSLPSINHLVDVVLLDGALFQSRVEDATGTRLTVAAPIGIDAADLPKPGTALELGWVAGDRRQAVDVRLAGFTKEQPPRWKLEAVGQVRLQTRRHYVRGGGGEQVRLAKGGDTYTGRVINVSEGGIRCRVTDELLVSDDRVDLRVDLGDDVLALTGTVLFVRRHAETESFDVIITYETSEAIGRAIRGYVLRREMEERRRLRESVSYS